MNQILICKIKTTITLKTPFIDISFALLILFSPWWDGLELNQRHGDFQSPALPTELPSHIK